MAQIKVEHKILGANDLLANKNRRKFANDNLLVLNLMSSPGAGKTTLLEKTIDFLVGHVKMAVIEGDLYTDYDAQRIEGKGIPVIQINTEGACHLDAGMIDKAYAGLNLGNLDLLVIENVGNLVCPAEFDLGEDFKTVILSTAEGNDKVMKYPLIFREARAIVLNKIDLLSMTDFDPVKFEQDVALINCQAPIFFVSGRTGEGIEKWCQWLSEEVRKKKLISH